MSFRRRTESPYSSVRPWPEHQAAMEIHRFHIRRAAAVVTILLFTPFCIRYFLMGAWGRGIGCMVIVALLAWQATVGLHRWYSTLVVSCVFLPMASITIASAVHAQGAEATYWTFPLVAATFYILRSRWAWIASFGIILFEGAVAWRILEPSVAIRFIIGVVLVATMAAVSIGIIDKEQRRLERLAVTDPLTGLLNRLQLDPTLKQALDDHASNNIPASLVLLDIDHFKMINDRLGHSKGDDVIQAVATLLIEIAEGLPVYRLGGEEFLVQLNGYDLEAAQVVAEEIRRRVAEIPISNNDITMSVSVSLGVSTVSAGEESFNWLQRADNALYRAKAEGRNQVIAAEQPE